jgi:hypothetical protein
MGIGKISPDLLLVPSLKRVLGMWAQGWLFGQGGEG